MNKPFKKALFIFRRDLRLEDNTGLLFALKNAQEVIPCFIFTPEQIEKNSYKSSHCLQFMIESLEDLEDSLKAKDGRLYLFYDKPEEVVETSLLKLGIDAVIVNKDYTPYSIQRDKKLESLCKKHNCLFQSFDDVLLHPPETTLKSDGKPYTIFTPFYRNALKLDVLQPVSNLHTNYYKGPIAFAEKKGLYEEVLPKRDLLVLGGRSEGKKILKNLKHFKHYEALRDFPEKDGTTHLSAHLKFTTLSPREVYLSICKELGPSSELIRSLYWRDFFTSIAFYFPHVFSGAFRPEFNKIHWKEDPKHFKAWCEGKTGFPLVDAGMREMNETGFMHNRVRMIAASLLVKDLHIDWRLGEKYFAKTLLDYDPAVNNGNWQWVASTGCDAQPYFRVFNPWTQSAKFDPDCTYIKKWIPELASIPAKAIHNWHDEKFQDLCPSYPSPLVDHAKESKAAIASYKKC